MSIQVRPIYSYRSLRGYVFGIFCDGKLTVVTLRYPSHLLRGAK